MVEAKPSTSEKELASLHSRGSLIMMTGEEETLQGMKDEGT